MSFPFDTCADGGDNHTEHRTERTERTEHRTEDYRNEFERMLEDLKKDRERQQYERRERDQVRGMLSERVGTGAMEELVKYRNAEAVRALVGVLSALSKFERQRFVKMQPSDIMKILSMLLDMCERHLDGRLDYERVSRMVNRAPSVLSDDTYADLVRYVLINSYKHLSEERYFGRDKLREYYENYGGNWGFRPIRKARTYEAYKPYPEPNPNGFKRPSRNKKGK